MVVHPGLCRLVGNYKDMFSHDTTHLINLVKALSADLRIADSKTCGKLILVKPNDISFIYCFELWDLADFG